MRDVEEVSVGFVVEVVFVIIELGYFSFGFFVGSESSECRDELMGYGSIDFEVVLDDGIVGCWCGERNFGGWFKSFYVDNLVVFVSKINDIEKVVDFIVRVCGLDSDVIIGLVG